MDRLGILSGIKSEEKSLAPSLPPPEKLVTLFRLSGATAVGATAAAQGLRDSDCTHLLSWGLAGALDPKLRPGSLLLPETIMTPEGDEVSVAPEWHGAASQILAHLKPITAPLLGVDHPVSTIVEKLSLFHERERRASSIDMESLNLARIAREDRRKLLVIRVVVDAADMALPDAAQNSIRPDGDTDLGAVLKSLLRQPGQVIELTKLGLAASKANTVLLRCANLGGGSGFGIL